MKVSEVKKFVKTMEKARNQRIFKLFKKGLNNQEIGDKVGITRERVRQILETLNKEK